MKVVIYTLFRYLFAIITVVIYPIFIVFIMLKLVWDFKWLGFKWINDLYTKHYSEQYDSIFDYLNRKKNNSTPDTTWMND